MTTAGDTDEATAVFLEQRKLTTLLKALYVFANLFMTRLLGAVLGSPDLSVGRFLNQPPSSALSALSLTAILPAYCVYVYRNKVIAHHSIKRGYGAKRGADGTVRLVPFPNRFKWQPQSVAALRALKTTYDTAIPNLAAEGNYYEQLRLLFYNVPIGGIGAVSSDRYEVDGVAEQGGCESMSRIEILEAINDFAIAVAKAI